MSRIYKTIFFVQISKMNCLCPQPMGMGGHINFGVDPVGIEVSMTRLSAQYLVHQWLDSYQVFMAV